MSGQIQIPKYASSAPLLDKNCQAGNEGLNIISPPIQGSGGLPTEVTAGFSMQVTDNSNSGKYSHEVIYSPYESVQVSLGIITKASTLAIDSTAASPCLKGTVLDEIECSWSYNAIRDSDIKTQSILNTGSGTDPTLTEIERSYIYSALTIQNNESVTITGADDNSSDNDIANIVFGNYLAIGVASPSLLFRLPSEMQAIFDSLVTKDIKTTQENYSFNAFGGTTEFMVIGYPASWGDSLFTKGVFEGGYLRIYAVNRGGTDMLVTEFLSGDTELAIPIDNGNNGFTEDYYFYMSEFPARTASEPTIISKA